VPAAAEHPQPELDHEQARVFGRITVDHRLPEHPRRRRVGEAKSHPDVFPREVGAAPDKQPHRGGRAAHDRPGRVVARKRLLRLAADRGGAGDGFHTQRQALGTMPRWMPTEGQRRRPPRQR
jgi:hypothetical protein